MEMKMHLVRRFSDNLPVHDYGVSDAYYAVGLFTDENIANAVMEMEKANIPYDKKETTVVDVLTIEVDKIYKGKEQIYLGGGFYIE